jgi:hypothetical protein
MKRNTKIIIITFLLILFLLVWAPWLNDKALHDQVLQEKGKIDGTIDRKTGELICDYNVMWFPFGRYVASCEGGWFVTFYGNIL